MQSQIRLLYNVVKLHYYHFRMTSTTGHRPPPSPQGPVLRTAHSTKYKYKFFNMVK